MIIFVVVPRTSAAPPLARVSLFDFRPVLRNRPAMAYAIVSEIHTLVMSALRGWGAFTIMYTEGMLANTARSPRSAAPAKKDAPMPMPSAAAESIKSGNGDGRARDENEARPRADGADQNGGQEGRPRSLVPFSTSPQFGVPSEACSYRATGIRL